MNFNTEWERRRLATPRTSAIAGILFGLLFSASLVLMRTAFPDEVNRDTGWITAGFFQISLYILWMRLKHPDTWLFTPQKTETA